MAPMMLGRGLRAGLPPCAQALLRPPLSGLRSRGGDGGLGEDGGDLVASRVVRESEVAGLQHLR